MKSFFKRITSLTIATTAAIGSFAAIAPAMAVQFGQREVNQENFVAVAAPIRSGTAHQLLVLEQISSTRPCWNESGNSPVQVDPLLVNFDFTGICGRSTDSNGYSIRVNGEDLGLRYSLRVVERDGDLLLIGAPGNRSAEELLIARANGTTSDFAKLELEEGWRFTKRTYGDTTLGHVYLTYEGTTPPIAPDAGNTPTTPRPVPPGAGAPIPTPPSSFRDISRDIYASEIQAAVDQGFIAGFAEDNTFRPQESLTREQLVSMVLEAIDRTPNADLTIPTQVSSNPYGDVPASRWSAPKIEFARQAGIVSGYEDGTFRPTQPVTRAELIAVLRRAAMYANQLQGESSQLSPSEVPFGFSDITGHWAQTGILEMSAYCDVASPLNETGMNFAPDRAAQRNYAAAATLRMLNCLAEDEAPSPTASR